MLNNDTLDGNELLLYIGVQQGILPENNILQAIIEITDVGKFNASFVFDVEIIN